MIGRSLERLALAGLLVAGATAGAAAKEVTVAYQLIYSPWAMPITNGTFEKETGYEIRWLKFDSGSKVINAMASGDVQIGVAGSSPLAAGASQGIDYKVFWILDDIADAEALVVRDGSGIDPEKPETLKGKTLGVPFVSTTHFHTLFALELWGIDPDELRILNMQPNQIAAAWARGDVDAAFVWDPALARIKDDGKVMITSGELSKKGKATFDGIAVMSDFARENAEFMTTFVKTIAEADAAYRDNVAEWKAGSPEIQAIVDLFGGEPENVPPTLELYDYPTLEEQASQAWLGGGAESGAAKALKATSEFLKAQGKVDQVHEDYGRFVTSEFVEAAMGKKN
ncbi:taurine ABC transporter substrate-binding protein [Geminicoccaceae bacterium 1502E]|nr:taurine ABC transporter substrate-binding protein [Geminicoccaceae bacterium 1502E]